MSHSSTRLRCPVQYRKLVSLIQDNVVAANVRNYLCNTLEDEFARIEAAHDSTLCLLADDLEVRTVLGLCRKEASPDLHVGHDFFHFHPRL